MSKVNILIAGATGYIGVQLVKILNKHKYVKIKYLCGNSSIGKNISFFDKNLQPNNLPKITKFNKKYLLNVDVIFTALPNGESQKIANLLLKNNILIDLSADFRLQKANEFLKWYKIKHKAKKLIKKSIYALTEIKKKKLNNYKIISCPGCYPTSVLLPIIPLLNKSLISSHNIIIDSKSGYSGAGRKVHLKYKNRNLYESLSAYGLSFHRHNSEIQQELNLTTNKKVKFQFTPHLTPMFRGILSTIYVDLKKGITYNMVDSFLKRYYKKDIFIKIMKKNTFLSTNDVINTNNCLISVCKSKYKDKLIILSAIDNLIKGGSGQAVQNMNVLFNFRENEGLNV
tara:strand:- start:1523 stop:2548 length:1026 start_codon:yes stop_codon:yes gene_type:complete